MEPSVEPPSAGSIPWMWVAIDPDGRYSGERWARPSASAQEIADELMAVLAYRLWRKHRDREVVRGLLPMCVVHVARPQMQGWPAAYAKAQGVTWLDSEPDTRGDRGEAA